MANILKFLRLFFKMALAILILVVCILVAFYAIYAFCAWDLNPHLDEIVITPTVGRAMLLTYLVWVITMVGLTWND